MLKCLLFLALIFSQILLSSQKQVNRQEANWQIGLQVNTIEKLPTLGSGAIIDERYLFGAVEKDKSQSFGVMGSRSISEECQFKLKFDFTNRNIIQYSSPINQVGDYTINKAKISQFFFRLSPGICWLMKKDRLGFFGGFGLPVSFYGSINISGHTEGYISDTLSYIQDIELTIPKGISFGVGSFLGFSINLSSRFSVGSEISFAYLFSKIGFGITELVATETIPNGTPQVQSYQSGDAIQRTGIFNLQGCMSISYFFKH